MAPTSKKYNFSNLVALVTGCSTSTSPPTEIALQFAQYGAQVTITGSNAEVLEQVSQRIQTTIGGASKPMTIVGDLQNRSVAPKLVQQTVAQFGKLNILVNGSDCEHENKSNDNQLESCELLESFDKSIALNVRSALQLIQLCVPHLEKSKGTILNISSISPNIDSSASNAALDGITKVCARQLGPKGIRVNSINFSPSTNSENVANLASFLVSGDASNLTGSIIVSDGGAFIGSGSSAVSKPRISPRSEHKTNRFYSEISLYNYDQEVLKNRQAKYEIHPILLARRSLREMTSKPIPDQLLFTLFEAARWTPSHYNVQNWRFGYAKRDTKYWDKYLDILWEGNQAWAKDASVLVIALSKKTMPYGEKTVPVASHSFEVGSAWMAMALEGTARGLVMHAMGGYDQDKAAQVIGLNNLKDYQIEVMISIGYPSENANAEATTQRNEIGKFVSEGIFVEKL